MEQYYLICAYVLSGIFGLCVGSFLNVVIYRVPNEMSLAKPGSHCPACGYSLKWYDNIPVVSWVMLGGKCRSCRGPISVRYTLVEVANMLLWLASALIYWEQSPVYACTAMLVSSLMVCVFFIDLEHMLIFNRFVLLTALAGVVTMFHDSYTAPFDHLIGLLVGGGAFAALYFGAILVLKREGMGFGDVKLVAAAGFLLGWQKLLLAILLASVLGSIVLVAVNRLRNQERDTEYPFGPFLVGGILLALLAGEPIITWYLGVLLG